MPDPEPADSIALLGGEPALDFANTITDADDQRREHLHDYPVLVAWAARAGTLTAAEAPGLLAAALAAPAEARETMARARQLREAIIQAFAAAADGRPLPAAPLAVLQLYAQAAAAERRLVPADGGAAWAWRDAPDRLDRPLWPVALGAVALLTGADLGRVKRCHGDHCGWLFVDRTKNRSRRWCRMGDCGNLAKVRRYRRQKSESTIR